MEVKISVRTLVEFLLRYGDIDNSTKSKISDNAMQEGSRIHRMLQRRMGADYSAEVSLSYTYETKGYQIIVDGRADGIFSNEKGIVVDEIKGTYGDVSRLTEAYPIHLAQAKCYAFIFGKKEGLTEINVRMTYCNLETEELKYFYSAYTILELEFWFMSLLTSYEKWAEYEVVWKQQRLESIKQLEFPFDYREGQKKLAVDVYSTICHGRKLFIEAPTGVGKTITTIFPSVKAVGEGKADKIFYLTAKTITRTVALDTFHILTEHGLKYKTLVLTAKDKVCFLSEPQCNPSVCECARGHYDRINDAVYDLLTHEDLWSREVLEEYANKHKVCPFEMSLDMSLFADAIICDYNYLFDPHVYLKRFFAEGRKGEFIFLIDEAHNLVERARSMYTAEIRKEQILAVRSELKHAYASESAHGDTAFVANKLIKTLDKCNKIMLAQKRACEKNERIIKDTEEIRDFTESLLHVNAVMEEYLEKEDSVELREHVLELYFLVSHFLMIWEEITDDYAVYNYFSGDNEFNLRLFCINPHKRLKQCMDRGVSSILFSATLLPIQYYKKLLGGESKDYEVYAHSVFKPEQMGLFIAKDVTTRYTQRTSDMYQKIARQIDAVVSAHQGNYIVFLPSHAFASQVYSIFTKYADNNVITLLQEEYMNEEARENFLASFSDNGDFDFSQRLGMDVQIEEGGSLVAFSVMGGIFSEGIDLKGDSLIGAIIVGNGFPQVCFERELLKNYFNEAKENGFDYAFRFPGMNKVLQSAGRVIRTAHDRGVVVLLENRFLEPVNQMMFPREWKNYSIVDEYSIGEGVMAFWNQIDRDD